jgi:ParB-like chromosome segregation protein Spo0J
MGTYEKNKIDKYLAFLLEALNEIEDKDILIENINNIKIKIHEISPFKTEPVDCVIWEKNNLVKANDYNPNEVAPPEMELLKLSILEDGYTQPIVTFKRESFREVVDGFHRNRVGKESKEVKDRVYNYLPIVSINKERSKKGDRIASTIRHNRARGKHKIDSMSNIVIELKKRNWSDKKISKHLGMDADEVLRLSQITGLAEMFLNKEFSEAWESTSDELYESNIDLEVIE